MPKKLNGNHAKISAKHPIESRFQTYSITNYKQYYDKNGELRPSEDDTILAKKWVDENHK